MAHRSRRGFWLILAATLLAAAGFSCGVFLNDREAEVQAVTGLGAGYWVVTPLVTDWGFTVLVNRGFVPQDQRDPATRPDGQIRTPAEVTGLLRVTEPGGGFLQSNDPGADRWYSRDVAAIAQARDLGDVVPYFIDEAAAPGGPGAPVGGLTVRDHLVRAGGVEFGRGGGCDPGWAGGGMRVDWSPFLQTS